MIFLQISFEGEEKENHYKYMYDDDNVGYGSEKKYEVRIRLERTAVQIYATTTMLKLGLCKLIMKKR